MNLNVIRRISIEATARGVDDAAASVRRLAEAHDLETSAVERSSRVSTSMDQVRDRQRRALEEVARSQRQFASSFVQQTDMVIAANDNLAKSWRDIDMARSRFKDRFAAAGLPGESSRLEREVKRLGLQDAVVTGMLQKTKEGFVILQAPAHGAASAISQVNTSLNTMTASADPATRATGDFTRSLNGIAAAGVVVGTLAAIRQIMDELSTTVDRGSDTRLGADMIQALDVAATRARVPLTDMAAAIDRFTAVSKKADEDAKEFHKALSNIDPALSAAFKNAPNQVERLRLVAAGLSQARDEVQRYQLATEAFGSDNDRLISVFSSGAGAIDRFRQQASALGITIDEAFIKKSQEAQAQINEFMLLLRQRLYVAVVDAASAVSGFRGEITALAGSLPSVSLGDITEKFSTFSRVIKDVAYDFANFREAWELWKSGASAPEIGAALGRVFDMGPGDSLRRAAAVSGQEAGQAFKDSFYDAMRGPDGRSVNKNDQALRDVPALNLPGAFSGRPSLKEVQEATKAFDAYDNAVQRVKDQIEVLELQAQSFGKNTAEVVRLRTELDLKRAAQRAGVELSEWDIKVNEALAKKLGDVTVEVERMGRLQRGMEGFFNNVFTDIASGVDIVTSLSKAFNGLGRSMIDIGSRNFTSGLIQMLKGGGLSGFDPVSLGIGAAGMALTAIFGERPGEKKRQAQYEENISTVSQIRVKERMIGVDTATRAGEFAALEIEFQEKRLKAQLLGQGNALLAEREYRADLAALQEEWARRDLEREKSYQDRLFLAITNADTEAGALAIFDRAAMRQREEEMKAGGAKIADLEAALAAERLNVIQEFNDRAIEEQKRAQEQLLNIGRSITDYLLGLQTGAGSPLSPSARLSAAQSAYTATLGLAQSGNMEALSRITQDAEAYRLAGQSYYGSSSGYQSIFNQITSQLGALPAVSASTDPVVSALANVVAAINLTTQAAQGTTSAVNDNTAVLNSQILSAVQSGSASATATALLGHFNTLGDSVLTFEELVSGLAPLARDASVTATTNQLSGNVVPWLQNVYASSEGTTASVNATTGQLAGNVVPWLQNVNGNVADTSIQVQNVNNAVAGTTAQLSHNVVPWLQNVYASSEGTTVSVNANTGQIAGNVVPNLAAIFSELDGNGNGVLERSELIRAATVQTAANVNTNNSLVQTGNTLQDTNNSLTTTSNSILTEMRTLNTILTQQFSGSSIAVGASSSSQQLYVYNPYLDNPHTFQTVFTQGGVIADNARFAGGTDPYLASASFNSANDAVRTTIASRQGAISVPDTVNNSMLSALNKIVWNTHAIAFNTARPLLAAQNPHLYGVYAEGGVIPPFGLGLVSEHSPGGGRFIRAGSEPITVSPHAPMAMNDNRDLIAELRQLRRDVQRMEQRLAEVGIAGAEHVGMKVDAQTAVSAEVAKRLRRDAA